MYIKSIKLINSCALYHFVLTLWRVNETSDCTRQRREWDASEEKKHQLLRYYFMRQPVQPVYKLFLFSLSFLSLTHTLIVNLWKICGYTNELSHQQGRPVSTRQCNYSRVLFSCLRCTLIHSRHNYMPFCPRVLVQREWTIVCLVVRHDGARPMNNDARSTYHFCRVNVTCGLNPSVSVPSLLRVIW